MRMNNEIEIDTDAAAGAAASAAAHGFTTEKTVVQRDAVAEAAAPAAASVSISFSFFILIFHFSFLIFIFHFNFDFLIYFCHRWYLKSKQVMDVDGAMLPTAWQPRNAPNYYTSRFNLVWHKSPSNGRSGMIQTTGEDQLA